MSTASDAAGKRRVVVCADDFGLCESACTAIVDLAAAGSISAASCIVDGPQTQRHAQALLRSSTQISLGLHFNLTEPHASLLRAPLRVWLLRSCMRRIDGRAVHAELIRQLRLFQDLFDRQPAFIDGHEHVHQLPGIAEVLISELAGSHGGRIAVRSTMTCRYRGMKAQVVQSLGGQRLAGLARAAHLTSNTDFAGVYDLSARGPYMRRMWRWLESIADGGLIMCHPQTPASMEASSTARTQEYSFLSSSVWPAMIEHAGVQLAPLVARSAQGAADPARQRASRAERCT